MATFVFGVDVGGTSVKMGLFSAQAALLDKWEIPTRLEQDGAFILPDIAVSLRAAMERHSLNAADISGIGIAVPGSVDKAGVVHRCDNLGWGIVDVGEALKTLLPEIPRVIVCNDANAAALGELWNGGGAGYESAVMFTLGTGVGGGIVIGGKIVNGANGGAGELGHVVVEADETELCSCGKRGCLEQYASANGIVRMAQKMLAASDEPSALRNMDSFTARELCDLARSGEYFACRVLDRFGEYMGRAMSSTAATVDPDIFVIGGGMSRAGSVILDAIVPYYRRYAYHVSVKTPIVLASLGNDAGIYGCAKMALS
ncbi:MAG: ROK family glucokinase [Oscillospiraceae bacterium]|nr:ROK family glucokinase [Oscillospiraceae bacterium]